MTHCLAVPPAVVLCSSVRRTDSPSAFLTGSARAPVAHPDAFPPRLLRALVSRRRWHRRAQARFASRHRWGRPVQRKKTQPSTSNIGEADRRCIRFDYAQRGPHGPPESESRHPVTNPGLSDLSAQGPHQRLLRCTPTRARARAKMNSVRRTDGARCPSIVRSGHAPMSAPFAAPWIGLTSPVGLFQSPGTRDRPFWSITGPALLVKRDCTAFVAYV